jgi:hypothetical protein
VSVAVAITSIICKTVIWLGGIGAFIRVAPPVLARLGITNTQRKQPAAKEPEAVAQPAAVVAHPENPVARIGGAA